MIAQEGKVEREEKGDKFDGNLPRGTVIRFPDGSTHTITEDCSMQSTLNNRMIQTVVDANKSMVSAHERVRVTPFKIKWTGDSNDSVAWINAAKQHLKFKCSGEIVKYNLICSALDSKQGISILGLTDLSKSPNTCGR